MNKVLCSPEER